MALSDLQTDLTSLKYGASKPTVQHKMGNKVSQFSARIDDVKRLGTILTRAPGRKFAINQCLLQSAKIGSAIGNKLGSGGSVGGAVLAGLGAAFKATVGTGLFLTANAAKAGTGFHGVNPSVAVSYLNATRSSVDSTVTSGDSNFLDKVISTVSAVATAIGAQSSNYHAGKEILGGSVEISKDTVENELYKLVGKEQGTKTIEYSSTRSVDKSGKVTKELKKSVIRKKAFDKEIEDKERYGESGISRNTYKFGKSLTKSDLLSSTSYYHGEGDARQAVDILTDSKKLKVKEQDIIPFTFNFYTPGSGETDKFLYFRALLDSMTDTYTAGWGGIKYVGRAEEFYNYNSFGRTFSFSFKAAAFSKKHLFPLYRKLNHLVGGTAPTYGSGGLFMRGTLLKLTIGDYLIEQNGFLTSVSLAWNTDYPWEIEGNLKVPHLLDVSCEFTPIHTFNPEFGVEEKDFIGNGDKGDTSAGSSGDFSSFTGENNNSADFSSFLSGG
jgi:hypothetical protein